MAPSEAQRGAFPTVMHSFISGGVASATAKTIVAPFERIRLLLQTQSIIKHHTTPYRGLGDALRRIPREQGLVALWRGNTPNVVRIIPTYALRFGLFDMYRTLTHRYVRVGGRDAWWGDVLRQMVCGGLSGLTTVVVTHPLDLIRTRLSADLSHATGRCGVRVCVFVVGLWREAAHTHLHACRATSLETPTEQAHQLPSAL